MVVLTIDNRQENNGAKWRGDVVKATLVGAGVGNKGIKDHVRILVENNDLEAALHAQEGEPRPIIIYPFKLYGEYDGDGNRPMLTRSSFRFDFSKFSDATARACGTTKARIENRTDATPVLSKSGTAFSMNDLIHDTGTR